MFTQNGVDTYQFIRGDELKKRETLWGTVYLDTRSGCVHFVERWRYDFTSDPNLPAWTDDEICAFHSALSCSVTGTWDSQTPLANSTDPAVQQFLNAVRKPSNVRISVSGYGDFANRFAARGLDVDFDIVVTTVGPQWRVTLKKISPNDLSRAEVDWGARRMRLHSNLNRKAVACQEGPNAACARGFVASPHEFGHTIALDDEYTVSSPSRRDLESIMNIGAQVRPRHYAFITQQLNLMMPGCRFWAANA